MKKIYIILILFMMMLPVTAQRVVYPENIEYTVNIEKQENSVNIAINVLLDRNVYIPLQGMVVLTPTLITDNKDQYHLAPAVIAGSTRYKVTKRLLDYGNPVFEKTPQAFIKRRKRSVQKISLNYTLPYQKWMHKADIVIQGDASGCVNCGNIQKEQLVMNNILPPIPDPHYLTSYIVPEAEVKVRSETFVARINYVVARYELLPNFKNNASVLKEVDDLIRKLQSDKDITITKHTVRGYASPEGNFYSNITLSRNRARAFMNYLQEKYGWDVATISHEGYGEDWDGLKKVVTDNQYIPNREEVIMIIDKISDITRRKLALQKLDGGQVYFWLLREVYPSLRRNEFEISYIARPFNVEEAREVIRTRPHLLSLNEMFLVANSYPKNSEEFKEVFDIAVRIFPDNPISKINAAAMEIETGAVDRAVKRLVGIESPEAWNNLGVAYAIRGDLVQAGEYFRRAAQSGNADAMKNLEQLKELE